MAQDAGTHFIWSRGLRFPADQGILPPDCRKRLRENRYEQAEFRALMQLARPGDRVLELGAGIGFTATALSVKAGVSAVTAYEANPQLIPYIRRVLEANGAEGVELVNAVLAPIAGGPVPFHVREKFTASSLDAEGGRVSRTEMVEVHEAGNVMTRTRPTLLVCDIEGAEAELLPALDLGGLRAAVVELHEGRIGAEGVRRIFDAMHGSGLIYCPAASRGAVVAFLRGAD